MGPSCLILEKQTLCIFHTSCRLDEKKSFNLWSLDPPPPALQPVWARAQLMWLAGMLAGAGGTQAVVGGPAGSSWHPRGNICNLVAGQRWVFLGGLHVPGCIAACLAQNCILGGVVGRSLAASLYATVAARGPACRPCGGTRLLAEHLNTVRLACSARAQLLVVEVTWEPQTGCHLSRGPVRVHSVSSQGSPWLEHGGRQVWQV